MNANQIFIASLIAYLPGGFLLTHPLRWLYIKNDWYTVYDWKLSWGIAYTILWPIILVVGVLESAFRLFMCFLEFVEPYVVGTKAWPERVLRYIYRAPAAVQNVETPFNSYNCWDVADCNIRYPHSWEDHTEEDG